MPKYLPLVALAITSCSSASAITYNSDDDMHCYALSLYFDRSAIKDLNQKQAPDYGILSTLVVGEWYRERWEERLEQGAKADEPKAVYEGIGADFEASKTAYIACSERATRNPKFDGYARTLLPKMATKEWWAGLKR